MNELVKITNSISNCNSTEVTGQIMTVCRAITPQFYKGLSDMEVKAEKMGIELLTSNIDQKCMAEMCKLAVLNYPKYRSENPKGYFDINFILTFYKQAFNKIYSEDIYLPKNAERISCKFDKDTGIISEIYQTPDNKRITIQEIMSPPKEEGMMRHLYSKKYFNNLWTDPNIDLDSEEESKLLLADLQKLDFKGKIYDTT